MTREPEPDTDEDPPTRAEVRAVAGVDVRADALAAGRFSVDAIAVDPVSVDPREARARAAFRAARDAGAHRSLRTRRRDDWRPARARRRWHGGHRP